MKTKKVTKMKANKSPKKAAKKTSLKYVIVRCRNAGVHAGELVSDTKTGGTILLNSRRIWYWSGAASLSELAVYGAKDVTECRFAVKLTDDLTLRYDDVCEIIVCQSAGRKMIEECPEWRA